MNYYPGSFLVFTGYLRQGKTASAVYFARRLHNKGWRVVSNLRLSFGSQILETVDDFRAVRKSVILLDEVQATLDSREFHKNVDMTQEAILLGKRGNILIMTCPAFNMVDKRFRQLTRDVFVCKRSVSRGLVISHLTYYQYSGVGDQLIEVAGFVVPISQVFGCYDTLDERVKLSSPEKELSSSRRRTTQ